MIEFHKINLERERSGLEPLDLCTEKYHFDPLPAEIYFADHVPFLLDAVDIIAVNVVAILLTIAATWFPARAAAQLDPLEAMTR